jgi:3-hydroxybutyryl-CoA dehydrogenase
MNPVWILGTGRMARSIGAYLLASGRGVVFWSRDPARRAQAARFAERLVRRAARVLDRAPPAEARLLAPSGPRSGDEPPAAVPAAVIESIEEQLEAKRAVLAAVAPLLPPGCPRLTNASSLLPQEIGPAVLGLHFFYPVELCPLVELVLPPGAAPEDVAGARSLAEGAGLTVVEESGPAALLANRLWLPLQGLAAQAVSAGLPPAEVDQAARGGLLPLGPLGLMDAVGLDTVAAAVDNFLRRDPGLAGGRRLAEALAALRAQGRRGREAGDGFLGERALPWPRRAARPGELEALERACRRGLRAGVCQAWRAGWLSREALGKLWEGALGIEPAAFPSSPAVGLEDEPEEGKETCA